MQLLKRMVWITAVVFSLIGATAVSAKEGVSIVGHWKTIDDVTGKPKASVQIKQGDNGEYIGIIEETYAVDGVAPLKNCEKCKGERKNQPIIGMTFMWGMKEDKPGSYTGGHILDPKTGKTYSCSAVVDPSGKRLTVRGFLGVSLLGRTQTWIRE